MTMRISTILFDLGSTLIYSKDPWPPIYEIADQALLEVLQKAGYAVNKADFFTETGGFIRSYYEEPFLDNIEPTTYSLLKEWAINKGLGIIPEAFLRQALKSMYSVTQENWHIEGDTLQTLETLRSSGYQLGLISNTSDDQNVQTLLDRLGLRRFFGFIVTSAALKFRKPDPCIYQLAMDHFKIKPAQAAMVGDNLVADVGGANRLGIYSIWITRRVTMPVDGELEIQPQAVITGLSQLPSLLEEIQAE